MPRRVTVDPLSSVPALRVTGATREPFEDRVIEERPVAMVYNGRAHAVMLATPADLEDFALGFSLSEGIVDAAAECELVDCADTAHGISLQMAIPHARYAALEQRSRSLAGRTGCGLCGVESLEAAIRPVRHVAADWTVPAAAIGQGLGALAAQQPLNVASGGVHAAGHVTGAGLVVREDVGRHNALDKLIGALARDPGPRPPGFLAITSRASYEIVHKAAAAGIAVIAAISAPTALAIRLADEAGITLIAFARGDTMNVYTHARRIA